MLTSFVLAGLAAAIPPAVAPDPLPDRWLLKLIPDNLPTLTERFYSVNWYQVRPFMNVGPSWELWVDFRKAGWGRPAEAILTLPGDPNVGNGLGLQRPTAPGHRSVPLAVHGPLVEFERKLYTATIRIGKSDYSPHTVRETLHLGSAIELKDRVWYQAGTTTPMGGKGVFVEEWQIDFQENPRTADRGKATLRGHWRLLTEPEGKSFDAEVRFHAGKTYTGGRTVTLLWPIGMEQTRCLPCLKIEDAVGGLNVMQVDGMHRLSLYPAPKPRPELPVSSGLVQPPVKKRGK